MAPDQEYDDAPISTSIKADTLIDNTPPDVEEFLSEIGISDKAYTCSVKRIPLEGGSTPEFLPGMYRNSYPEINEIGEKYGPGTYFICFSWKTSDGQKQKTRHKNIRIRLGEEYQELCDAYQAEQWLKHQKRIEKIKHSQAIKNAYKGDNANKSNSLDMLKESIETARNLGVPIGPSANLPATKEDAGVMTLMIQMFQFMAGQQMENSKNMLTMMIESNKTNNAMLMAMMSNNKPQSNNELMREVLGMVRATVDLKNALNPQQQSTVDRIFSLMESAFPAIIQLASKPKSERARDPLLAMATNSPDFKSIANDPKALQALIDKWDAAHGEEQTNIILETAGLSRPGQTPPITQTDIPPTNDTEYETIDEEENDSVKNPLTEQD